MRYAFAPLALAALAAANPVPQGVTSAISPDSSAPAGCSPDYSGTFEIQVVNVTTSSKKRSFEKRANTLMLTLSGGILKDAEDRTGYIAANSQFQFDGPPQTGAKLTAGWSVCSNSSLAIGDDAIFYQCLSGDFYNLYDEANADQCTPVYIEVIGGGSASPSASELPDGQVTATPAASEMPDGQITAMPVSQISDGQIQATTAAVVSQISDGQPQAGTSGAAVSQIGDGQPQVATSAAAPITQISDGQIQAPTSTAMPVSQISDGQIQGPAGTGSPVSQIGDGQIQANGTMGAATPSVQPYTGGAGIPAIRSELFGLAAGILAVAML